MGLQMTKQKAQPAANAAADADAPKDAAKEPEFKWDEGAIACVATYKVLELSAGMDEFEDANWPIAKAGDLPMSELRSWPGVALPAGELSKYGRLMARDFLPKVQHMFHGKKAEGAPSSAEVINEFQAIFANETATLADLAKQVSKRFVFPK
jgi:hypothetical protein